MAYDDRFSRPAHPSHSVREPAIRPVEYYRSTGDGAGRLDNRSLGELFSELTRETRTLVRQEIELARLEFTDKAKIAGKNAGFIGLGGAVAYVGFGILMSAIVFLLGLAMPLWVASLIVGAIVAVVGYAFIQKGISTFKNTDLSLKKTKDTLKEDKQWIREEMR